MQQQSIYPVILSGGSGTRLWPLSRAKQPKQLQALYGEVTLFQETVRRFAAPGYHCPLVLTNAEHADETESQLDAIGMGDAVLIAEPAARNTAAAIAAAALWLAAEDPDALMLVAPADHLIVEPDAFHAAVDQARAAAASHRIVTFGIVPTAPETGYGYIRRGASLDATAPNCYAVDRFVEKPQLADALRLIRDGRYLWNSGIFLFSAARILLELQRFAPLVLTQVSEAVSDAVQVGSRLTLDAQAFGAAPSISIDYAVMERARDLIVVPADMKWSDVGSWSALWAINDRDGDGNVHIGDVLTQDTRNSYVRADSRLVAALGLENMVVVETPDAVMVAPMDRVQDVKAMAMELSKHGRREAESHGTVFRPWGSFTSILAGEHFQVKQLLVKPGHRLSLQYHRYRAEHWTVVAGRARATVGEDVIDLASNEHVFIPRGAQHRLENAGDDMLSVIEVQYGTYLGEDDIVRLKDEYGRIAAA